MDKIYLYTPRGYSPGIAYRNFDDAVGHLLEDEGYESLSAYSQALGDWWHEFDLDNKYISVDDGARVEGILLV